jgi:hypothetical protein
LQCGGYQKGSSENKRPRLQTFKEALVWIVKE